MVVEFQGLLVLVHSGSLGCRKLRPLHTESQTPEIGWCNTLLRLLGRAKKLDLGSMGICLPNSMAPSFLYLVLDVILNGLSSGN